MPSLSLLAEPYVHVVAADLPPRDFAAVPVLLRVIDARVAEMRHHLFRPRLERCLNLARTFLSPESRTGVKCANLPSSRYTSSMMYSSRKWESISKTFIGFSGIMSRASAWRASSQPRPWAYDRCRRSGAAIRRRRPARPRARAFAASSRNSGSFIVSSKALRSTAARSAGTPGGARKGHPSAAREKTSRSIARCFVGLRIVHDQRHVRQSRDASATPAAPAP